MIERKILGGLVRSARRIFKHRLRTSSFLGSPNPAMEMAACPD
jgi:hypothetical protein